MTTPDRMSEPGVVQVKRHPEDTAPANDLPTPREYLAAILEHGQVTELRAFVENRRGYPETWSGYYTDPDTLLEDAAELDANGASGVYFVPNPITPDALARREPNTCRVMRKADVTTSDRDIIRRNWILLDFDPVRTKGVSATDEEKDDALERAGDVAEYLAGHGFAEPVTKDSGNGYHAEYRVDLAADDGGLVTRLTRALSKRFSDDRVEVDAAVHNLARIWKLPGTTARKGYPTDDRPHRKSVVLYVPDPVRLTPREAAERALADLEPETPANSPRPAEAKPGRLAARESEPYAADGPPASEEVPHVLSFFETRPDYETWTKIIAGVLDRCVGDVHEAERYLVTAFPEEVPGEYRKKLASPRDARWPLVVHMAKERGYDPSTYYRDWLRENGAKRTNGKAYAAEPADDPPEPEPLRWQPMPLEVLPDAVADYATAHGAAINCDPAFVAVPALAVLATAIGTRYRVRLKRSWDEPATLWISTVAPSGSAKSPALDAALRPVRALEREAAQHYREEMLLYREDHKAWKALPKDERGETPEPEPPKRHRRVISDATVEAVMDRHADAPGGLLLARDEVSGWMDGMNRYANAGGEMQSWIELREGRPVTVDRKTGDTKVYFIGRPAVSVVGTTQPSVVSKSLTAAHFASGFAARLTLVMPPTAARRWTDADVSLEVFDAYDTLVRRLDEMPVPGEDDDVPTVELSPDARRTFAAFVDENGDLMDSLPDGPLRSAYAKIEALAARFALIFHLSDHVTGPGRIAEPQPINGHTMERAVYLARWIRHETARIYDALGFNEAAKSDDEKIVDKLPDPFAWQDVADAAHVQRSGAFKIINRLMESGHVERHSHGKYTRRTVDLVDFVDFRDESDGQSLQSLQSLPSTESTGENAGRIVSPKLTA